MNNRFILSFMLLSLLVLVSAAPSRIQKRSFKVERVPNTAFTGRNGPKALAKAYRKFGVPLPQGLVDTLEAQTASKASRLARRKSFLDLGSALDGQSDRKYYRASSNE